MTSALPKIDLDVTLLPDELTLVSLTNRDVPSWLVQKLRTHVSTQCGICGELLGSHEYAYYELNRPHAAHVSCWIIQLTARPVRVTKVWYR
jgi:hypothetical protein